MKLPLLSLLLICFGVLAFTRSSPQQISKFSYIMNTLTRPYSDTYNRIRNRTESSYNHLQSMILSGFTGSSSSEESSSLKKKAPLVVKDANLNIANSDIDEQEIDGSSRLLQGSAPYCGLGSLINTQVRVYRCGSNEVTKEAYDSAGGAGCSVATEARDVCYCPYDYSGDRCQTGTGFTCEIERISHPANCQGVDSHAYVYSFSGVPPCNKVQAGDTINFRTRAICSPEGAEYTFEGVKHSKYEVIQQPAAPTTFTYAISSDRVHISAISDPYRVTQSITFTNWKKMSDTSLSYNTPLSLSQIAGIDEINTNINFDYPLTQAATAGRYYFEMKISTSGRFPSVTTASYDGGYFEQAGYQEPAPPGKTSKVLIIVLPVLGGVLLIGLIVGYKIFQKRKEKRERQETAEVAPLMADE